MEFYALAAEKMEFYTLWICKQAKELWATGGFGSMESTGVIAGDIIVAGGYSNLVQALNRLTGEALWSFNAKYFVQGSPLIVDEIVYIATDHACYALDLHTE